MLAQAHGDPAKHDRAEGLSVAIDAYQKDLRTPVDPEKLHNLVDEYLDIAHTMGHLRLNLVLDGDVRDSTILYTYRHVTSVYRACVLARKILLGLSKLAPAQRMLWLLEADPEEIDAVSDRDAAHDHDWIHDHETARRVRGRWNKRKNWLVLEAINYERSTKR
jgi:hypothetical protein